MAWCILLMFYIFVNVTLYTEKRLKLTNKPTSVHANLSVFISVFGEKIRRNITNLHFTEVSLSV